MLGRSRGRLNCNICYTIESWREVRSNEGREWIKLGIGKAKNSTLGNHSGALEDIGSILEVKVYTKGTRKMKQLQSNF